MGNDVRFALRALGRSPGFAAVAIATLALGIGANTAIFSVVNGVLLRPLPYAESGALVGVWSGSEADPRGSLSAADFLDLDRQNQTMTVLAGYRRAAATIAGPGTEPVRVSSAIVTADYFDVFAMPAALGQTFNATADGASAEPLVVLSHSAWQRQMAGDPQVAGRRIRVNGVPHTVAGVMPAAFDYPEDTKLWLLSPLVVPTAPLDVEGDLLATRDVHYFEAVGRLKAGVSLEAANADFAAIAGRLAREFPKSNQGRTLAVGSLHGEIVGDDLRSALLMLLGAVGLVLLIACANIASLLLARAAGRQRELAVRSALGASRARLVRQLITESLLLASAGGAVGLVAGAWATAALIAALPEGVPRTAEIHLDLRVCAAAALVALGSALLFGLLPALQSSRADAAAVLHDAGDRGSTSGRRRARTRAAFVVAEIALTLVLLVGAGLLLNSFVRLQRVDPGFRVDEVTLVTLPVPQTKYPDGKSQAAFYERVLEDVRQRPGVISAALVFPPPFQGTGASASFTIEGRKPISRGDRPFAGLSSVSPEYFGTMGISIVKGRDFTARDREPAPAVIIVNQALARKYWPGEDVIGKRLRFDETDDTWTTIVGVAADSRNQALDEPPAPLLYLPAPYFTLPFMSIAARSSAGVGSVATAVREAVNALDPDMPLDSVKPMRQLVSERAAGSRFRTLLLGSFAIIALILAAIGVYGLISYSVTQRTREFGIRMALGAQPQQVMGPVLKEGLVLGLAGVALGVGAALLSTRLLAGFLFGVGATDPATFAAVAALLLAVALLASYIPSRRALRIDPIEALRDS